MDEDGRESRSIGGGFSGSDLPFAPPPSFGKNMFNTKEFSSAFGNFGRDSDDASPLSHYAFSRSVETVYVL